MESYSYRRVLDRGFAVVRAEDGAAITRAVALQSNRAVRLELADGQRTALITGAASTPRRKATPDGKQGKLL